MQTKKRNSTLIMNVLGYFCLQLIKMPDLKLLEKTTIQVRRDILRMVHKVNSGHPEDL